MTEYQKARKWREGHKLTRLQLSPLCGYSPETIYWMERGVMPPRATGKKPTPIEPWVWLRYKNAMWGVEQHLRGHTFDWSI